MIIIQSDILLAFFVIGEWALCMYRANGEMLVYRNAVLSLACFCGLNKCGIAMPAWEVTCLWLKSSFLLCCEADLSPFHISTPLIPFSSICCISDLLITVLFTDRGTVAVVP